jgi:membrane protease subunit HflK
VLQVSEAAFREVVGKSSMDFVLYEGREQIAANAHKLIQQILDRYGTGVNISAVVMQNAQPPEQVQAAFDDAVKAKQDLERQKNEGQAYYNDVVPKARGSAARLTEEANAYRQRIVANAEGESSRFRQVLDAYSKAPQVTRERLYLDTMQDVMTSTSKIMLDARSSGNVLFLPLDKIMQMSAGAVASDSGTPGAPRADMPSTFDPTARTRDGLRSRDREARP